MTTVTDLLEPVEADLEILLSDLRSLIGAGHPILQAAAEQALAPVASQACDAFLNVAHGLPLLRKCKTFLK